MRVCVYRNLAADKAAAGLLWSIRAGSRVIGYAKAVQLENPVFVVRQGGYLDMQRRREKLVHAWVRGDLCKVEGFVPAGKHPEDGALEAEAAGKEERVPTIIATGFVVKYRHGFDLPFERAGFFAVVEPECRIESAWYARLMTTGACVVNI